MWVIFFSYDAAIDVYPSYDLTSVRLFWEYLSHKSVCGTSALQMCSGPLHSSCIFPFDENFRNKTYAPLASGETYSG